MKRILTFWMLSLGISASLSAVTADYLCQFFPEIICPPQVCLGIPDDFVSVNGSVFAKYDTEYGIGMEGAFWGKEEVVNTIRLIDLPDGDKQLSPSEPMIWSRLSMNVAQTGPKSFSGSAADTFQMLKAMGLSNIKECWYQWGPYPVRAITASSQNQYFAIAHVGLNYCSNTLCISMSSPKPMTKSQVKQASILWRNLMSKTKFSPLPSEQERQRFMDRVLSN